MTRLERLSKRRLATIAAPRVIDDENLDGNKVPRDGYHHVVRRRGWYYVEARAMAGDGAYSQLAYTFRTWQWPCTSDGERLTRDNVSDGVIVLRFRKKALAIGVCRAINDAQEDTWAWYYPQHEKKLRAAKPKL